MRRIRNQKRAMKKAMKRDPNTKDWNRQKNDERMKICEMEGVEDF